MTLQENIDIRDRHTFHLPVRTRYWADFENTDELISLLRNETLANLRKFPVGEGSNLLFLKDFDGVLLHSCISSVSFTEADGRVLVRAGSGVKWDTLVEKTVEQGLSGLENLSGIPGNVGASPVQNIGAYGAEAADSVFKVEALDVRTLQMRTFTNEECRFGYRNSIFKNELKYCFIVCYVTYSLSIDFKPNTNYGDLNRLVAEKGGSTLRNVRDAILEIRNQKLPDPLQTGNAGSFFMNPEIPVNQFRALQDKWPEIPNWPLPSGLIKIPAAWLIDQSGWKGRSLGNAAVHDKQALVLINPGSATGNDIANLSQTIVSDVNERFGIQLRPEVIFL